MYFLSTPYCAYTTGLAAKKDEIKSTAFSPSISHEFCVPYHYCCYKGISPLVFYTLPSPWPNRSIFHSLSTKSHRWLSLCSRRGHVTDPCGSHKCHGIIIIFGYYSLHVTHWNFSLLHRLRFCQEVVDSMVFWTTIPPHNSHAGLSTKYRLKCVFFKALYSSMLTFCLLNVCCIGLGYI